MKKAVYDFLVIVFWIILGIVGVNYFFDTPGEITREFIKEQRANYGK